MDHAVARKTAKDKLTQSEQLLVRYDTPRRTLPDILEAFRGAHP
jgi:hypothetical protein